MLTSLSAYTFERRKSKHTFKCKKFPERNKISPTNFGKNL